MKILQILFLLLLCIMNVTAQAETENRSVQTAFPADRFSSGKAVWADSNQDANHNHTDKSIEKYTKQATELYEQGKYKEALNTLDTAITKCEVKGLSFQPQHLTLLQMRYSIYYNNLNNRYKAYKLMDEDMMKIETAQVEKNTIHMLNHLCSIFDYYSNNYSDFANWMRYFGLIGSIGMNIAQKNNFEPTFYFTFESYILSKAVALCTYFNRKKKEKDAFSEGKQAQASIIFESLGAMVKYLEQIDDVLRLFKEHIPKYYTYDSFITLLNAAEDYYLYVNYNPDKATSYMKEHFELVKDKNPISYATVLIKMGDFCRERGELDYAGKAYVLASQAITDSKNLTLDNKLTIASRFALLFQAKKDYENMCKFGFAVFDQLKILLDGNFIALTDKDQEDMITLYGNPASWPTKCLAYYPNKEKISGYVYNTILYSTGIQLKSKIYLSKAIELSNDKGLITLKDSLNKLRAQLKVEKFDTKPLSSNKFDKWTWASGHGKGLDHLNILERQVIERVAHSLVQGGKDVLWTQVRDKLHSSEAAIEFIVTDINVMALVVKPGCSAPVPVVLTSTDSLKNAMSSLNTKSSAATARKLYNNKTIDLYSMLWQPLEKELKGVNKVYYATQGMLYSIAFAAISTPDGKYLTDHYDLCPLTTTAELVKEETAERPQSILAMGNIYYTDKQRQQVAAGDISGARGGEDDTSLDDFSERGAKRYHFKYLPFTKNEIENLSSTIKNHRLTLIEETEATEQNLRKLLDKKPDVLHLATHGFFIAKADDARKVPFFQHYENAIDNSMQRAGIALSGAEDTWTGAQQPEEANDGILTANEVAQLDLQGTQLVALSACETALGDYSFEGVFGLPRGFKQAGVKSLLVSLWSVNDKSTSLLMSSFYRYWMQGETKQQAFKHAVKDVRKDYPDPFYWAPFMLLDALK